FFGEGHRVFLGEVPHIAPPTTLEGSPDLSLEGKQNAATQRTSTSP
ncbi:MAG: hypothetical protein RL692_694, partial [Planctomycetota bacterium]